MFARFFSMHLKSGNLTEFNRILEKEVIPLLQRQKGFREEIVLTNPNGAEAVGISIWEQKENAYSYNREKFSEVQQLLTKVLDGTPQVKTYEVSYSTIHKIAARATA
jgi:hypothetical protein